MKNPAISNYATRMAAANKVAILEAFETLGSAPIQRDDVAKLINLSRASANRYMAQLVKERLVVKLKDGDYTRSPDATHVAAYLAHQRERANYTPPAGLNEMSLQQPDRPAARRVAANKLAILAKLEEGPMDRTDARALLGLSSYAVNKYIAELHSARAIEVHRDGRTYWLATDEQQPERLAKLVGQLKERAQDEPPSHPGIKTKTAPAKSAIYKSAVHLMVDDTVFQPRKHTTPVHRDPLVEALFGPAVPA